MKKDMILFILIVWTVILGVAMTKSLARESKLKKELKETQIFGDEQMEVVAQLAYNNGKLIGIDIGRKGRNFDVPFSQYWNSSYRKHHQTNKGGQR